MFVRWELVGVSPSGSLEFGSEEPGAPCITSNRCGSGDTTPVILDGVVSPDLGIQPRAATFHKYKCFEWLKLDQSQMYKR